MIGSLVECLDDLEAIIINISVGSKAITIVSSSQTKYYIDSPSDVEDAISRIKNAVNKVIAALDKIGYISNISLQILVDIYVSLRFAKYIDQAELIISEIKDSLYDYLSGSKGTLYIIEKDCGEAVFDNTPYFGCRLSISFEGL